jgi:hypothetical protein
MTEMTVMLRILAVQPEEKSSSITGAEGLRRSRDELAHAIRIAYFPAQTGIKTRLGLIKVLV